MCAKSHDKKKQTGPQAASLKKESTGQQEELPKDKSTEQHEDLPKDKSTGQHEELPKNKSTVQQEELAKNKSTGHQEKLPKDKSTGQHEELPKNKSTVQQEELAKNKSTGQHEDLPKDKSTGHQEELPKDKSTGHQEKLPKDKSTGQQEELPKDKSTGQHEELPKNKSTVQQEELPKDKSTGQQEELPKDKSTGHQEELPKDKSTGQHEELPKNKSTGHQEKLPKDKSTGQQEKLPKDKSTGQHEDLPKNKSTGQHEELPKNKSTGQHEELPKNKSTGQQEELPKDKSTGHQEELPKDKSTGQHEELPKNKSTGHQEKLPKDKSTGQHEDLPKNKSTGQHEELPKDKSTGQQEELPKDKSTGQHEELPKNKSTVQQEELPKDKSTGQQEELPKDKSTGQQEELPKDKSTGHQEKLPKDKSTGQHEELPKNKSTGHQEKLPKDKSTGQHEDLPKNKSTGQHEELPKNKSTGHQEKLPKDKSTGQQEELPKDKSTGQHEELPKNKSTVQQEELPKDKSTGQQEELPKDKSTGHQEELPKDKSTGQHEELPKNKSTGHQEKLPKDKSTGQHEDLPKNKSTGQHEELPKNKSTGHQEKLPKDKSTGQQEELPKDKSTGQHEELPKNKSTVQQEELPKDKSTGQQEELPKDKSTGQQEELPKDKSTGHQEKLPKDKSTGQHEELPKNKSTGQQEELPKDKSTGHQEELPKDKSTGQQEELPKNKSTGHQEKLPKDKSTGHQEELPKDKSTGQQEELPKDKSTGHQESLKNGSTLARKADPASTSIGPQKVNFNITLPTTCQLQGVGERAVQKRRRNCILWVAVCVAVLICSAWTWIMLCPSARQPLIPPRCNGLTSNGQRMGEKGHKLVAGLRLALLGDRPIFPMYFQHDRGGAPWLSAAVEDTLVGCCRGKIVFSTGPLRTVADVRAFIEAPFREKSRECAVYVMRIEDIQGEGDGTQSLKELLENGSLMSDAVLPSGKKALVAIATSGTRADLKDGVWKVLIGGELSAVDLKRMEFDDLFWASILGSRLFELTILKDEDTLLVLVAMLEASSSAAKVNNNNNNNKKTIKYLNAERKDGVCRNVGEIVVAMPCHLTDARWTLILHLAPKKLQRLVRSVSIDAVRSFIIPSLSPPSFLLLLTPLIVAERSIRIAFLFPARRNGRNRKSLGRRTCHHVDCTKLTEEEYQSSLDTPQFVTGTTQDQLTCSLCNTRAARPGSYRRDHNEFQDKPTLLRGEGTAEQPHSSAPTLAGTSHSVSWMDARRPPLARDQLLEEYLRVLNKKDKQLHELLRLTEEQRVDFESREERLETQMRQLQEDVKSKRAAVRKMKQRHAEDIQTVTKLSLALDRMKQELAAARAEKEDMAEKLQGELARQRELTASGAGRAARPDTHTHARETSMKASPNEEGHDKDRDRGGGDVPPLVTLKHEEQLQQVLLVDTLRRQVADQERQITQLLAALGRHPADPPTSGPSPSPGPGEMEGVSGSSTQQQAGPKRTEGSKGIQGGPRHAVTEESHPFALVAETTTLSGSGTTAPLQPLQDRVRLQQLCIESLRRDMALLQSQKSAAEAEIERAVTQERAASQANATRVLAEHQEQLREKAEEHRQMLQQRLAEVEAEGRRREKQLQEELHLAESHVRRAEQREQDLTTVVEKRERDLAEKEQEVQRLTLQAAQLQARLEELEQFKTSARQEIQTARLTASEATATGQQKVALLERCRDDLQRQLSALQEERHKAETTAQSQLADKDAALHRMERSHDAEMAAAKRKWEDEVRSLTRRCEEAKEDLSRKKAELDAALAAASGTEGSVKRLLALRDEELVALKAERAGLMDKLALVQQHLEETERKKKTAEDRMERLEALVEQMRQKFCEESDTARRVHDAERLEMRVELTEKNRACAEAVAERDILKREMERAVKSLEKQLELEQQRGIAAMKAAERTQQSVETSLRQEMQTLERSSEAEKAALQQRIQVLEEQSAALQQTCATLQQRAEAVEKATADAVDDLATRVRAEVIRGQQEKEPRPADERDTTGSQGTSSSSEEEDSATARRPRRRKIPAAGHVRRHGRVEEDQAEDIVARRRVVELEQSLQAALERCGSSETNYKQLEALCARLQEADRISREQHTVALEACYDQIRELQDALNARMDKYKALKATCRETQERAEEAESKLRDAVQEAELRTADAEEVRTKYSKEKAKMDRLLSHYEERATQSSDEERASRSREAALLLELERCEAALREQQQTPPPSGPSLATAAAVAAARQQQQVAHVAAASCSSGVTAEAYNAVVADLHRARRQLQHADLFQQHFMESVLQSYFDSAYAVKSTMAEMWMQTLAPGPSSSLHQLERSARSTLQSLDAAKRLAEEKVVLLERQLEECSGDAAADRDAAAKRLEEEWRHKLEVAVRRSEMAVQHGRQQLVAEMEALSVERDRLQHKLDEQQVAHHHLLGANERLQAEVGHLRELVKATQQQLAASEDRIAAERRLAEERSRGLASEVQTLRAKLDDAGVECRHADDELRDLKTELVAARQTCAEREGQLQREKQRSRALAQRANDAVAERDDARQELETLRKDVEVLNVQLANARDGVQRHTVLVGEAQGRLEGQLMDLQGKLTGAMSEKHQLERRVEQLERQIEDLRRELEAARVRLEEMKESLDGKASEVSLARERCANFESLKHIAEMSLAESQQREENLKQQLEELRRSHQIMQVCFDKQQEQLKLVVKMATTFLRCPRQLPQHRSSDEKEVPTQPCGARLHFYPLVVPFTKRANIPPHTHTPNNSFFFLLFLHTRIEESIDNKGRNQRTYVSMLLVVVLCREEEVMARPCMYARVPTHMEECYPTTKKLSIERERERERAREEKTLHS
eukprot:gene3884-2755_t